ncbi:uncharacterized protein METZ01_LOCUS211230 [marine metagenome]|uniref:Uncharacterized protein n=1 Tax=marine metagenome TaxID=408172 RepID=A0A382F5T0_9ZZZZ
MGSQNGGLDHLMVVMNDRSPTLLRSCWLVSKHRTVVCTKHIGSERADLLHSDVSESIKFRVQTGRIIEIQVKHREQIRSLRNSL